MLIVMSPFFFFLSSWDNLGQKSEISWCARCYLLASDLKTSPNKWLLPRNLVGCQLPLKALWWPSVLPTFSMCKWTKGQVNSAAPHPSSPSFWWQPYICFAFVFNWVTFSSPSSLHAPYICYYHLSNMQFHPNFGVYLLLRETGREYWFYPTQARNSLVTW